MSNHYVSISDGKIKLHFGNDVDSFDNEDVAAETLASRIIETGVTTLLNSSSCDFPGEEGLPYFNYDVFLDKVQKAIDARPI